MEISTALRSLLRLPNVTVDDRAAGLQVLDWFDKGFDFADAFLASPEVHLESALIAADPLHNKKATLCVIVEKGGDYFIGTKENTRKRSKAGGKALEGITFLT